MEWVVATYLFIGALITVFAIGAEKNKPAKKKGVFWYAFGLVVTLLLWPFLIAYGIGLAVKESK